MPTETNKNNEAQLPGQDPNIVSIPYGFYDNKHYWTSEGYGIRLNRELRRLRKNAMNAAKASEASSNAYSQYLSENNLGTMAGAPDMLGLAQTLKKRREAGIKDWWNYGTSEEWDALRNQHLLNYQQASKDYQNWINAVNEYHNALNSSKERRPVFQDFGNGKMFMYGKKAKRLKYKDIHGNNPFPQLTNGSIENHPEISYVTPDEMEPSDEFLPSAEHNYLTLNPDQDEELRALAVDLTDPASSVKESVYVGDDSIYNTIDTEWGGNPQSKKKLKKYLWDAYIRSPRISEDVASGKISPGTKVRWGRHAMLEDVYNYMIKPALPFVNGFDWTDALYFIPWLKTDDIMKGFSAANKATKTMNALQKSRRLLKAADVASDISKATKANKILTNSKILGLGHRVMTPWNYTKNMYSYANRAFGTKLGTTLQNGLNTIGLSRLGKPLPRALGKYGGINLAMETPFYIMGGKQVLDGNWEMLPLMLAGPLARGVGKVWNFSKPLGLLAGTTFAGAMGYPVYQHWKQLNSLPTSINLGKVKDQPYHIQAQLGQYPDEWASQRTMNGRNYMMNLPFLSKQFPLRVTDAIGNYNQTLQSIPTTVPTTSTLGNSPTQYDWRTTLGYPITIKQPFNNY